MLETGQFYADPDGRIWWYSDDDHQWGYFHPEQFRRIAREEEHRRALAAAPGAFTPVESRVAYAIIGRAILSIRLGRDDEPVPVAAIYTRLNELWPFD